MYSCCDPRKSLTPLAAETSPTRPANTSAHLLVVVQAAKQRNVDGPVAQVQDAVLLEFRVHLQQNDVGQGGDEAVLSHDGANVGETDDAVLLEQREDVVSGKRRLGTNLR